MSPMTLSLVAGGLMGVFLIFCMLALSGRAHRRRTDARLSRLRPGSVLTAKVNASMRLSEAYSANTSLDWIIRTFVPQPKLLRVRLSKTGKSISIGRYFAASGILAVMVALGLLFFGLPLLIAIMAGLALGMGIPHLLVGSWIKKRAVNFTKVFPDGIDLIVRGLRSGLPVSEGIQQVGREMPAPVGVEFAHVANDIKLGRSMDEALSEASLRLDTQEFKFFITSLSVQQETGGNLAETLANLAAILRRRSQMRQKIKAMSSEARASALIIGALPFVVILMLMVLSPGYLTPLYTDTRGMMMGGGALATMGLGVFIMMRMINFDI